MKPFLTLIKREWLQHRTGWTLLALVPLGLALLLLGFGQIQIDSDVPDRMGDAFPVVVAMVSILLSMAVTFTTLTLTSAILVAGLARRDHQDRSIEFWLSLPVGHPASLAAPLLVHLLVVPAAALAVGLLGGLLVSAVAVARLVGFDAWAALPWADVLPAVAAAALRVLAGLPLAMLWLLPLTLALVLSGALFKRWGLPVLMAVIGVAGLAAKYFFGQPIVGTVLRDLGLNAARALVATGRHAGMVRSGGDVSAGLRALPGWAAGDVLAALQALATPLFAGAMLVSALLFALLVEWRRRGR